ncbi:MAG: SBBP repeat-containing protein [Anaerolineae bacterium]
MATAIARGRGGQRLRDGLDQLQRLPHHAGRLRHELQRRRDDAFVAKLNPAGSGLAYATFLGGSSMRLWPRHRGGRGGQRLRDGRDHGPATSPPRPAPSTRVTTASYDAFVAKLNPAGSGLVYATFLGGSGGDDGHAIAVDGAGSAYVTGEHRLQQLPHHARRLRHELQRQRWTPLWSKLNPAGSGLTLRHLPGRQR